MQIWFSTLSVTFCQSDLVSLIIIACHYCQQSGSFINIKRNIFLNPTQFGELGIALELSLSCFANIRNQRRAPIHFELKAVAVDDLLVCHKRNQL